MGLLQAGRGDSSVPASTTEALARSYNATIMPNSPFEPFGLPHTDTESKLSPLNMKGRHSVTLTELLFEKENRSSITRERSDMSSNNINMCIRTDAEFSRQVTAF